MSPYLKIYFIFTNVYVSIYLYVHLVLWITYIKVHSQFQIWLANSNIILNSPSVCGLRLTYSYFNDCYLIATYLYLFVSFSKKTPYQLGLFRNKLLINVFFTETCIKFLYNNSGKSSVYTYGLTFMCIHMSLGPFIRVATYLRRVLSKSRTHSYKWSICSMSNVSRD